jgi:lipopolysaccharide/colanic/teichoic acid biosynthesis glycosyltransferase
VQASDEGGPKFKLSNDPRVTRVGHILRKTSLDELPQLVNVLKGEMSLVGPRPLPTYEVAEYQAWHRERLAALPGITGLWQVQGRCEVTFEEQVQMDIEYVRNQSLWQDIKILLSTIPAVVSGRGAE